MTRFSSTVLTAVAALLLASNGVRAQQAGTMTFPVEQAPTVVQTSHGHTATSSQVVVEESGAPPACKICVSQPKPKTKTVYSAKCEEYCLPTCSLFSLFGGSCGNCADGNCGNVRVRHRLVVKKVDDCPTTTQCVVQEAPVPTCATTEPATAPIVESGHGHKKN